MANSKIRDRVNDDARSESDLSQVLAHGPALSAAYGRYMGAAIMMAAIMKASRGPLGIIAAISVIATVAYRYWAR
jgi:hypothetical protein